MCCLPSEHMTRPAGAPGRLAEVAGTTTTSVGVSPINEQCRTLLAAIRGFAGNGVDLPVYWGNRNWHPMLADTLATMRDDGVRHALAFVTSAYGSYSSCRQYLEDIAAARAAVGPQAPLVSKLRHYYDHPGFVEPLADGVRRALTEVAPVARAHPIGVRRPLHPGGDGAVRRSRGRVVRGAAAPDRRVGDRGGAPDLVGPGVAGSLRTTAGAVAGAGHQRLPGGATPAWHRGGGGVSPIVRLRPS